MDSANVVKLTNKAAFIAVGLLAYWVFIFVAITVFDFKVFKENITQAFYLSILGVFSLLGGAIILNIMLNMTRISESLESRSTHVAASREISRKWKLAVALSFPAIFILLYVGDLGSSMKKRDVLVEAATYLAEEHRTTIEALGGYTFGPAYLELAANSLKVLTKVEKKFPTVAVVVSDVIEGKPVFLAFNSWYSPNEVRQPTKEDFIFPASKTEREHLTGIFTGDTSQVHFTAHDGRYELYFPVKTSRGVVVLYLSDSQRYGKYGS